MYALHWRWKHVLIITDQWDVTSIKWMHRINTNAFTFIIQVSIGFYFCDAILFCSVLLQWFMGPDCTTGTTTAHCDNLSSDRNDHSPCNVWQWAKSVAPCGGGLIYLCYRLCCPINIMEHDPLPAARLPFCPLADRSQPFTQGNIILLRCFELQWDHCLRSGLFSSPGGREGDDGVGVSYPPEATKAPCACWCLPQIIFIPLQVKWQSCLPGDVCSPLLEQVWTCWICGRVKTNRFA